MHHPLVGAGHPSPGGLLSASSLFGYLLALDRGLVLHLPGTLDSIAGQRHTIDIKESFNLSAQKVCLPNREEITLKNYRPPSCTRCTSAPQANASDLWHHVVYRIYMEQLKATKPYKDPGQSWKRASGDAFELFLADYYNTMFKNNGLRLIPLTRDESKKAFNLMGISGKVGDSKLDIAIIKDYNGKSLKINNGTLIRGIHVKASLAERVSDDVPASTAETYSGKMIYTVQPNGKPDKFFEIITKETN